MKPSYLYKALVIISIITTSSSTAQISKQWESRYSETGYLDDGAQDIIADASGNSFVLGNTGADALVIKYDANANLVWSFQAGRGVFMEDQYDPKRDFKLDAAGNILVLVRGYEGSNYGLSLIKLAPDGKMIWRTFLQGAYDEGKISLAVHTDGSAFVLRRTSYDILTLAKFTSAGAASWTKTYNATDESFVQQVSIINNSVVVWHYAGYQPYQRRSYLHVYDLNGNLAWQNDYKYETQGTYITGVQYHGNELVVSYYIASSSAFNQIIRYAMSTGTVVKSFNIQMDATFQDDEPISVMYVGDDSHVYVMGDTFFKVKKFSLEGIQVWSLEYNSGSQYRHQALDFVVNESTSTADVLLKTENLINSSYTYSVVSFKPNKSTGVVDFTSSKAGAIPTAMTTSGANIFLAGSWTNGAYNKDLLAAKFTRTNSRVWDVSFTPSNSEQHEPTCMASDGAGNIYVGGLLSWDDDENAFGVIKYSPDGQQLWSRKFAPENKFGHGTIRTMVMSMAVTPVGDIVVTGGIKLGLQSSTGSEPAVEMYTVKLNTNGDIMWTAKTSSPTDDYITGLVIGIDDNKNVYTLGSNYNINDHKRDQMVLVKYDANGNQKWEKRFSMYTDYNGTGNSGPDSNLPKMKIVNNTIYIASKGAATLDDYNYYSVLELRKFSTDGTETLVKQIDCGGCGTIYYFTRDLHIDATGNIFLLWGQYQYWPSSFYGHQNTLTKFSPAGQTLWSKGWSYPDGPSFPTDGTIALNASNEVFVTTASGTEFNYSKVNASGDEVWNKKEELKGFDSNFGHPVFACLKADGNPVFISTNENAQKSKYYFICERDRDTGEINYEKIFDETYDTFGGLPYWRPGDQLVSFLKSPSSDDIFITGVIEDKSRNSETIVTLKYSFGVDDGDGDGGDVVTGVEQHENGNIHAYPTITNDGFRIDGANAQLKSVGMFDSFGRCVQVFNPQHEYFDISGISSGIYFIRIQTAEGTYIKRIVKR